MGHPLVPSKKRGQWASQPFLTARTQQEDNCFWSRKQAGSEGTLILDFPRFQENFSFWAFICILEKSFAHSSLTSSLSQTNPSYAQTTILFAFNTMLENNQSEPCWLPDSRQPTPVFLPGESPWTEEPRRLQSTWSQRVRQDWETKHSTAYVKSPSSVFTTLTTLLG